MQTLIWPTINLAVLIGILVHYLRAPLKAFVGTRHHSIRDELERVAHQLRQAQHQFDEFTAKLKAIDAEIHALREQARQDGAAAKVRVLTDAKRLAAIVVTDARAAAEGLFGDLREQLRTELAERVLTRAEAVMRERLTGDDRARIRQEFSRQVGSIQ